MKFNDTKFLFFTGKGGVGKTSLSSAVAVQLADAGKQVLLISTDPASNLSDVLATDVSDVIKKHTVLPQLSTINIDPEHAGEAYKDRAISSLGMLATPAYKNKVREQLSGACTVEIASFDEFTRFISGEASYEAYDYVVFDTAPTGHTLRLLELPEAWSSFLDHNEGASCIGPSTALKSNHLRYKNVVDTLRDPKQTTFFLVARPDAASLKEADRTSEELFELGMDNQKLLINGIFSPVDNTDEIAVKIADKSKAAIETLPKHLAKLEKEDFPLLPYNILGLEKLRSVFSKTKQTDILSEERVEESQGHQLNNLTSLVDEFSKDGKGLIMTMGKGGVGKTTTASAIAVMLAQRGHKVTLTTTDPAAHLSDFMEQLDEVPESLTVERIDPRVEKQRYIDKVMVHRGAGKTDEQKKLILEDLNSPCTEEVAVFHAFSKVTRAAKRQFVVIDTAPTGHTLLLLDTTGSYHKEVMKHDKGDSGKLTTPFMMIQDPKVTKVVIVTLAETTPIREAMSLQGDLKRAGITPYAWVVNQDLSLTGAIKDPILKQRATHQNTLISSLNNEVSDKIVTLPYLVEDKILPSIIQSTQEV
ncbi:arsenical pump-driving ATPase [Flammeovirga kamogawensis]|uniref:arsenite-transporting ATPase n=1 Tax=Flammeovirga kamogawensis TaxID=373891 RepID=A0ABX8H543_9BACT|nr:arsenical pump-driving ATPase [Flammeovirga kamogawensis]MBB6463498.1 arsenite-transporting ATPase [Flammeovirga kamogawensis]QWG10557.1 arsenical pump-driving ATPase [Flammeovirga kamogawensis]TRX63665.1 arsenical pump-driving ATPase [Flammeovirga kamogawensis]